MTAPARARRRKLATALVLVAFGQCFMPGGRRVSSGPIVQQLTPHAATLLLHSRNACVLELECAPAGAPQGEVRRATSGPTHRHVFRLEGLEAARTYGYTIRGPGGPFAGDFTTSPLAGGGTVRFAAFGDSGRIAWWTKLSDRTPVALQPWLADLLPGRGHQWPIAGAVARCQPDLVLHLGDVVYPSGSWTHYGDAFFAPFAGLLARVPFYPTVGNHDMMEGEGPDKLADPMQADYFRAFALPDPARCGGRYYDFAHGPCRFVSLDAFGTSIVHDAAQLAWLTRVLEQAREPWRIVFTHSPFWTVSRSRTSPMNRWLRERLHPLLARHGVRLVLSGHDHVYQRFAELDGVHYIVAGGGGKSLYELDGELDGADPRLVCGRRTYSFVLCEALAERLRIEAIDEDGVPFDACVIQHNG